MCSSILLPPDVGGPTSATTAKLMWLNCPAAISSQIIVAPPNCMRTSPTTAATPLLRFPRTMSSVMAAKPSLLHSHLSFLIAKRCHYQLPNHGDFLDRERTSPQSSPSRSRHNTTISYATCNASSTSPAPSHAISSHIPAHLLDCITLNRHHFLLPWVLAMPLIYVVVSPSILGSLDAQLYLNIQHLHRRQIWRVVS